MAKAYNFVDCTEKYHSIMVFDKNKNVFVHRWYPFVEGYSKEFIEDILEEIPFTPQCALEPFSGSGTTAVELQNHGIRCHSFEVSPFMYLLEQVKLENGYSTIFLDYYINLVKEQFRNPLENIRNIEQVPFGPTVARTDGLRKWNFQDNTLNGLLDIRHAINTCINDKIYRDLFLIAFASIIVNVSNMFRNGKCLSYKNDWQKRDLSRSKIHDIFLNKLNGDIKEDIAILERRSCSVDNKKLCHYGDVRQHINETPDNSVDLVITSPPYLNSRDYTDIYMLELKMLELVKNYDEIRKLRGSTIRSHVQVKYGEVPILNNERLKYCLKKMKDNNDNSWNRNIEPMICAYFQDMNHLFSSFRRKMVHGGIIYFNVANSAYSGVKVPVDYIIADIAEDNGFQVREIRKARDLKTSPQQKSLGKLRESVIVIDA